MRRNFCGQLRFPEDAVGSGKPRFSWGHSSYATPEKLPSYFISVRVSPLASWPAPTGFSFSKQPQAHSNAPIWSFILPNTGQERSLIWSVAGLADCGLRTAEGGVRSRKLRSPKMRTRKMRTHKMRSLNMRSLKMRTHKMRTPKKNDWKKSLKDNNQK